MIAISLVFMLAVGSLYFKVYGKMGGLFWLRVWLMVGFLMGDLSIFSAFLGALFELFTLIAVGWLFWASVRIMAQPAPANVESAPDLSEK